MKINSIFRNGHLKRSYLVIYHFLSELHLQASTYTMSNKAVSVNSVNTFGAVEIRLHPFLNSALHGSKKFQRRRKEGFEPCHFCNFRIFYNTDSWPSIHVYNISGIPRNFVLGGVQQIQLRIEDRENGDLGVAAP